MRKTWERATPGLTVALSIAFVLGGATVAPALEPSPDATIHTAIDAAAAGDDAQLDALLTGPLADRTRELEAQWMQARGDFNVDPAQLVPEPKVPEPKPLTPKPMTGQYDYYCTSLAGVTLGWNGKIERACHGWMDVYNDSGRHVAHYAPDIFPDPVRDISFECMVWGGFTVAGVIIATVSGGWGALGFTILQGAVTFPFSCP